MSTSLQTINASASPEVQSNENFESLSAAAIFAKRQPATNGLTWAYYGGRYAGNTVANGTVSLTDATTNYVVVARSSGTVSTSTSTTNWNDPTNYARLYQLTTSGGVVTAVVDERFGAGGLFTGTPAAAGTTGLLGLTFTSDTGSTADSDPGNGLFKWNHATQASATVLYIDNQTADAVSTTTIFGNLASTIGYLLLQQADDSTRWQLWRYTAAVAGSGYYKFTVSLQAKGADIVDAETTALLFMSEGAANALSYWTESLATTSPNDTTYAARFLGTGAATDIDAVLQPKGAGAILAHLPDGTATGGDKRGSRAVDLQTSRSVSTQVASGSSSFVAGENCTASNSRASAFGNSNTASGANSAALGGTNGTASGGASACVGGNTNTANATDAGCFAGTTNTASGIRSFVGGGNTNTASAANAACVGGNNNQATASDAVCDGGQNNLADGTRSLVHGTRAVARTTIDSYTHGATRFAADGDNQFQRVLLSASTTNATQTTATTDRNAAGTTNQLLLVNNSAYVFKGHMVVRENATGDTSGWSFEGVIKRGANAAATAMVAAATVTVVSQDAGATAWALAVDADTTNGTLRVRVTGEASKTLRWSGYVEAQQVAG